MHAAVVLALLDQAGIMLGALPPFVVDSALVKDPHHAAQETFAPVRPGLAFVLPLTILCVHGEGIGMLFAQLLHLILGELEGVFELWAQYG